MFIFKCLFIFGCTGSSLLQGLTLVAARWGYSLVSVLGLLIASLPVARGFRCWLPGAKAKAQQLWHPGMAAPWHMGSSQIRDQTHLLNLQADSLSLSHQESPLYSFFKMCNYIASAKFFKHFD